MQQEKRLSNYAILIIAISLLLLSLLAKAQTISPSGVYGASNTSSAGGVSVNWVLGSLTPHVISALPVKLIDFKCKATDASTVLLEWSTSEEVNSDYFEIQHSKTGKQWSALGRVEANGDSKTTSAYTYEHITPAAGTNYYRLKMVDQDKTYAYSIVRNIHFEGSGLTFHPNPVMDRLNIEAGDWGSLTNLKITNAAGKEVGSFNQIQLQKLSGRSIDFQDFPSGIYMLSITRKDGTVQSGKVFKN